MRIRLSNTADAQAMAGVYVQTWQDTYRGILPDDYLNAMTIPGYKKVFSTDLQDNQTIGFVAEEGDRGVVGFVTGGYERSEDHIYNGEIYTLYVLKDWQRMGIGFKLVSVLAKQFNRFGIYSMMVWVLKENPNRRFYEKINGVYLRSKRFPFAGTMLEESAYGWIDTDLIYPSTCPESLYK